MYTNHPGRRAARYVPYGRGRPDGRRLPVASTITRASVHQRATGMPAAYDADAGMTYLNFPSQPRQMYIARPDAMSAPVDESLNISEHTDAYLCEPPSASSMTSFGLQGNGNEARLPESMDRIADLMSQLVELHTKDLPLRAETNELLKQLNASTANVSQNTANILQSNANLSEQLSQAMNKLKTVDEFTNTLEGFMHDNGFNAQ